MTFSKRYKKISIVFLFLLFAVNAYAAAGWVSRIAIPVTVAFTVDAFKKAFDYIGDEYYYWQAEGEVKSYSDFINKALTSNTKGILFEIEVLDIDGADSLLLAPAPLGSGETPAEVATQFLVGAPTLPSSLNSMTGVYIDSAKKIREALGSGVEVSKKSYRVWASKTENGKIEFKREPTDSNFLSSSIRRAKVRKLSRALIADLPTVEGLAKAHDINAELIEEYRTRSVARNIYLEIVSLNRSRELAAHEMRSALQLLESAKERQKKLGAINAFQNLLTIGSITYNYSTATAAASDRARLDAIQEGVAARQNELTQLLEKTNQSVDALRDQVFELGTKVSKSQRSINLWFINNWSVDNSILPLEDVKMP